jgi:hypothetical protein
MTGRQPILHSPLSKGFPLLPYGCEGTLPLFLRFARKEKSITSNPTTCAIAHTTRDIGSLCHR